MATARASVTDIRPWQLGQLRKQLRRPRRVEQMSFSTVCPTNFTVRRLYNCKNKHNLYVLVVTFVSRLYPTSLPRPISIQYSVTWRPTSSLSPCGTSGHLFAQGPISVFVSRYTWYECAAGREKQGKNLIETRILENAVLQLPLVRGRYVKISTAWYNIEKKKKKKKKKERAWEKETKDKNGKWRKMHRLIMKTIELFYMDTF